MNETQQEVLINLRAADRKSPQICSDDAHGPRAKLEACVRMGTNENAHKDILQ